MRPLVMELAECLDDAVEVQNRLLDRIREQREAIVSGEQSRIEEVALRMETDVLRLGGIESSRNRIAAALADQLGVVSARWSVIREALAASEREHLAPRVARVEELVRDLELQNTINGQLVRTELEIVDVSIRSIARTDRRTATRAYAPGGRTPSPDPSGPMLLNLAA